MLRLTEIIRRLRLVCPEIAFPTRNFNGVFAGRQIRQNNFTAVIGSSLAKAPAAGSLSVDVSSESERQPFYWFAGPFIDDSRADRKSLSRFSKIKVNAGDFRSGT